MDLTFGIVTIRTTYEALNFEKKALCAAASQHFREILLIDPQKVTYKLIRGENQPSIFYQGRDISNLSALHIRSFAKRESSTAILAHTLAYCGCILNDPIGKFTVRYGSKLLMTLNQFKHKTGSSSFLAFDYQGALNLLRTITQKNLFPLIVKPIDGRQGQGIQLLRTLATAEAYTYQFFQRRPHPELPIFFQTYIPFVKEYRVFVIDREILDMVRKVKPKGVATANAATGAFFFREHNQQVADFIRANLSDGIYGLDVAVDKEGGVHLIETNRAPNWQSFQKATGIDVATTLIQDALKKIKEKDS